MRALLLFLLLASAAWAQTLPSPPPRPSPVKAGGQPFDPARTVEAPVHPPLELRPPGGRLTVLQAVMRGLQEQPDVQTAQGQLLTASGRTQVQRAPLLPHLQLNGNYNDVIQQQAPAIGQQPGVGLVEGAPIPTVSGATTSNWTYGLTLTQLLWDFEYTSNLVLQADRRAQAAGANLFRVENDVALQVKERYYLLLARQRQLTVVELDLANRTEQLRMARALYQAGQRSPGDVVRAQTTVSTAVYALNQARRDVELARQELCLAMGVNPLTPVEAEEVSEPPLGERTLAEFTDLALKRRPDVLAARHNVEASQAGVAAAERLNMPAIYTRAGLNYQGPSGALLLQVVSLQLAIDFNVYDGGQRAGAIKVADGQLTVDEAELLRTLLNVRREVSAAYLELGTAERNVEAAHAARASAEEGVRIADGRYRAAMGTITDVFDAQSALVQSRSDYVASLAALDLARSRLRHALAQPFDQPVQP